MSDEDAKDAPGASNTTLSLRKEGGVGGAEGGSWGADVMGEARDAVIAIMRGGGGRNAMARLAAARAILDKAWLRNLSDSDLLAELQRRAPR